ncbi:MAG: D-aminoacyl-tRNA deacylase [Candidatus Methanoplasma sp.]|jgi:D-aminoacyl-tRNA deacylase|nr:D-aminoacyl-tRNA deacylase [Candidatus Methanoplasma sp.]
MRRLLVCIEGDVPSANMRDSLLSMSRWEEAPPTDEDRYFVNGDTTMVSTPNTHIYADDINMRAEKAGFPVDEVVFMSKHAAASGEPALTVHPIGNFHESKFGGRAERLVPAAPASMTSALRLISSYNTMPEFKVCFEVTHHGPWLSKPTFFIEIGSDERNWPNKKAADVLAKVLTDCEPSDYPVAAGVAGGHYAPRFTEIALGYKVNIGHMLPNYHLEGRDDADVARMMEAACAASGTDLVYIHRKSLKGPEERRIKDIAQSLGKETITSADLDLLGF